MKPIAMMLEQLRELITRLDGETGFQANKYSLHLAEVAAHPGDVFDHAFAHCRFEVRRSWRAGRAEVDIREVEESDHVEKLAVSSTS